MIEKKSLKERVESNVYDLLNKDKYEIVKKDPQELLTWNRLTVIFNLFYLKYKEKYPKVAINIYKQRVRATSLGKFSESKLKSNFNEFVSVFDDIYEDIKQNDFDHNKTIIPLAKDGSILNGSHRLACCLFLNKPVYCIQTDIKAPIDDWHKLFNRNIDHDILSLAVREFVKYCNNCYIAFLFPSCKDEQNKTKKLFKNIVYEKDVVLNTEGTYNLLVELYKHMIEWDGRPKSGFHGVKQKECFPSGDYQNKIKVMVFQEESLDRVISIKKKIRKVCNIGHSSIHITDTKEEVLRISELIFNNNGIHFLNYANPYKYHKSNIKNIDNVLKYFEKNKIKQDDILIDSSMLLSLYGLRKNEDIDFLTNKKITSPDEALDAHDSVLKYHAVEKNELIYNSRYYFIYNNIKFVSFDQLFKMKSNRGEEKDIKDCEMMNALIESNDYKKLIAKVKQNIFYFRVRYKKIINLVMVLLLYILVCNIFGVK